MAHLNKIGDVICFQGATAKNEALVAAFEQKLQKPIFVSNNLPQYPLMAKKLLQQRVGGFEKVQVIARMINFNH